MATVRRRTRVDAAGAPISSLQSPRRAPHGENDGERTDVDPSGRALASAVPVLPRGRGVLRGRHRDGRRFRTADGRAAATSHHVVGAGRRCRRRGAVAREQDGRAGGRVRVERLRGVREDARRPGGRGAADQREAARRRRWRWRGERPRLRARGQASTFGQAAPVRRAARRVYQCDL